MSYLKTNEDEEWTTDSSAEQYFTKAAAVEEKVPNNSGRKSPSMLDEKTMFYSITNGQSKESMSCVWRATATGDFLKK